MFSEEVRSRLRLGKYTRWAADLEESHLLALLWMIGEFGYRASIVLPLLGDLREHEGSGRALLALESLFRAVGGDRPDLDTYTERVRAFLAEVRGYADELPGPPAHHWPVLWRGRLVGWLADPVLEDFGHSCSGVWHPHPTDGAEFVTTMAQPSTEGASLTIGGIPAFVKSLPDDKTSRIAFWIRVSPH